MNPRPSDKDDLEILNVLLPRLVDGQLSDSENAQLASVLQRSEEAQAHYLRYLQLNTELKDAWGAVDEDAIDQLSDRLPQMKSGGSPKAGVDPVVSAESPCAESRIRRLMPRPSSAEAGWQLVLACMLLLIVGLSIGLWRASRNPLAHPTRVAEQPSGEDTVSSNALSTNTPSIDTPTTNDGLAQSGDASEDNAPASSYTRGIVEQEAFLAAAVVVRSEQQGDTGVSVGHRLSPGILRLADGTVQLEFMSGAVVALEGPAELKILSKDAATLVSGAATAYVPPRAHGFMINAPNAAIVDLGTEFGVRVSPSGVSEIEVLSGEVELSLLGDDGNTLSSQRVVEANRVRVDHRSEELQTVESIGTDLPIISAYDDTLLSLSDQYAQAIRTAEPILYWRFQGDGDDPLRNEMGNRFNAEVVIAGESEDIRFENGIVRFERGDDSRYLTSTDVLEGFNEKPYTIEFWMKPDDLQHSTCIGTYPVSRVDSRTFVNVVEIVTDTFMIHEPGAVRLLHRTPPHIEYEHGKNVFSPGICVPGQWHHVVAVRSIDSIELFINGQRQRRVVLPPKNLNSPGDFQFRVGELLEAGDSRRFLGAMDELAIYGHALSESEIREHYELITSDTTAE
ncbi:LamG-like jellyroll fold domain-containing protein [Rhodopirellula sallentina]|uniref:FecR protein domain protein n=1 Tax=Rhodopirellula sallentina SM41 TaxID=1263870 RepID=M5U542_9BACT|nr:LamG-like jellyroll fold domain-containing protein [Rhodopirellula sallentina]EMI52976.1 FecR protein domain protein [Rhodopirellula sallentina SM41]